MKELALALMMWIGAQTGYQVVTPPPTIFLMTPTEVALTCAEGLEGKPKIAESCYKLPEHEIYLDRNFDLKDPKKVGVLVHELTHVLQLSNGRSYSSATKASIEEEADRLESLYEGSPAVHADLNRRFDGSTLVARAQAASDVDQGAKKPGAPGRQVLSKSMEYAYYQALEDLNGGGGGAIVRNAREPKFFSVPAPPAEQSARFAPRPAPPRYPAQTGRLTTEALAPEPPTAPGRYVPPVQAGPAPIPPSDNARTLALERQLAEAQRQLSSLKGEIQSVRNENRSLSQQLQSTRADLRDQDARMKTRQLSMSLSESEIDAMQRELLALREENRVLRNQKEQLTRKYQTPTPSASRPMPTPGRVTPQPATARPAPVTTPPAAPVPQPTTVRPAPTPPPIRPAPSEAKPVTTTPTPGQVPRLATPRVNGAGETVVPGTIVQPPPPPPAPAPAAPEISGPELTAPPLDTSFLTDPKGRPGIPRAGLHGPVMNHGLDSGSGLPGSVRVSWGTGVKERMAEA